MSPPNDAARRLAALQSRTASGGSKRKHPARGARAGALAVSCLTTAGLTFWFSQQSTSSAGQTTALPGLATPIPVTPATSATTPALTPTTTGTTAAAGSTATTPVTTPTSAAPATTVAAAAATTQAFDGSAIDTRYGPVQVQVQITGGKVSDIAVLEYPTGHRSDQINADALPILRTETLAAQSAHVDSVSGATYTSNAYVQSLQSAIDQARAAGATTLV